jgi:membrane-associated phospholipid phosphatase
MPTFMLAFFYFLTPEIVNVATLETKTRWSLLGFIWLYTFMIPVAMVYYMYSKKWIQSVTLQRLEDRRLPFIATALLYLILSIFMIKQTLFFYSTAVLIFGITVISTWWQISAHSAAVGGIVGILFIFNSKYDGDTIFYGALLALVLAGAVMTSRLKLNAHNLAQVVAGFFVGIVVSLGGYFVF